MRKIIPLLITIIVFALPANAQLNRYIILLNDKADNSYTLGAPEQYLSQRALQRRALYNIAIDSADLPVTARYIDSIRLAGAVTILNTSKWLNQVAIFTTDAAALSKINAFPFVKSSIPVGSFAANNLIPHNKFETELFADIPPNAAQPVNPQNLAQFYNYGLSNGQVKIHKGDFLHNHGFRGEGMQMAVLDAGFYRYLTLPTFDSIRINNQILGTWDFVSNEASVNEDHYHGMMCLSTIAANMPESFIGTAPKTSFYLYRTENVAGEYPIEEQNYAAGLERADSLGVDVSSTSLGYFNFDDASLNYSYNDMNGNTSISARAADMAAKKGMLMVVAAGNEGNKPWHYLITPSDADSVLSVGAVDTLGNIGAFSSYGPSSDGQIKPGVAAVGWNAMVANVNSGTPIPLSGTSFACPNMAGLATCLWQAFPEENNMGIISALQQSASKATAPDDRVGYGIPDMKKAFVIILKRFYKQEIKQAGCNTFIKWTSKNSASMSFEIQRKLPSDADFVSLYTQNGSGSFANGNFNYSDDLSSFITPLNISYRIKMNIDTDTSFYFDPVTINHVNPCNTYTFTGNGNWNVAANWEAGIIPPAILPAGSTILINPSAVGECILNTSQEVSAGAYFNVMPGKKIFISGNLNIHD
jgi:serine protease AprX